MHCFGILKWCFHILKHWSQQKCQADIDIIFVTYCILHNLILEEDGYLKFKEMDYSEEPLGVIASICHKMYAAVTKVKVCGPEKMAFMKRIATTITKAHLLKKDYGQHIIMT